MTKLKSESQTIDTATGEVVTVTKSYSIKTSSEEFYMTFINHMSPLLGLDTATDRKLLDFFCKMAEFNTGRFSLTAGKRKQICEEIGISPQTFANTLTKLKSKGLISGESGDFLINPHIFWKGTTDERAKLLKEQGLEIKFRFTSDDNI